MIPCRRGVESAKARLFVAVSFAVKKARRLGLEVVKQQKPRKKSLTSSLELPKELPSVEEALKVLAGAFEASREIAPTTTMSLLADSCTPQRKTRS